MLLFFKEEKFDEYNQFMVLFALLQVYDQVNALLRHWQIQLHVVEEHHKIGSGFAFKVLPIYNWANVDGQHDEVRPIEVRY